jgi:hypothetical protein
LQQSPHGIIDALITNLSAEFNILLTESPEPQYLNIRLRTILYPNIETLFQITATGGPISYSCKPPPKPLSLDDVKDYILWATACALAGMFSYHGDQARDQAVNVNNTNGPEAGSTYGWQTTHSPTILKMPCKNEMDSKELRIVVHMASTDKEIVEVRADFKHIRGGAEILMVPKKSALSATHIWESDGSNYAFPKRDIEDPRDVTLKQFVKDAEKWTGASSPTAGLPFKDGNAFSLA